MPNSKKMPHGNGAKVAPSEGKPAPLPFALSWIDGVLLGALAVVALLLRLPQLRESLWIDELHTAWTVGGGLWELPRRAALGNQSPVYFLLPWLSVQLLGLNEFALRLPSLLAGAALVPVIYVVALRWSGWRTAAVVAAALAAIDPDFIYFSGEARAYACVQLAALVQVALFAGLLRGSGWQRRAAWIGLSALLFYLHYTAILLVAAEAVYLLLATLVVNRNRNYSLKAFGCDVLLVGLLLLPAAGHLLAIARRRENWTQFVHAPRDLGEWQLFPLAAYLIAPLLVVYVYVLLQRIGGERRPLARLLPKLPPIALCLLWMLAPPAIVYVTTRTGAAALWMTRYVIGSAAAVVVLAGLLCALPSRRAARIAAGVITLAVALFCVGPQWAWLAYGLPSAPRQENWREAVARINADQQAADWPILLRSGLIEADALRTADASPKSDDAALREFCLLPIRSIYAVDPARVLIPLSSSRPGDIVDSDLRRIESHAGAWLVVRGRQKNAQRSIDQVLRTLRRRGVTVENTATYECGPDLRVLRLEFAPAGGPGRG